MLHAQTKHHLKALNVYCHTVYGPIPQLVPRQSTANFVATDSPSRPSVANHGCHRWFGLATSDPLYSSLLHAINSS